MGIPVKQPKLTTVYRLAYHRPKTSVSHSCPTQTGVRLMLLPEAKPKKRQKMISWAIPLLPSSGELGSHTARTEMRHKATVMTIVLNRPNKSAM